MAPIQGPDGDFSRLRAARSRKSMRQVEGDDFHSFLIPRFLYTKETSTTIKLHSPRYKI